MATYRVINRTPEMLSLTASELGGGERLELVHHPRVRIAPGEMVELTVRARAVGCQAQLTPLITGATLDATADGGGEGFLGQVLLPADQAFAAGLLEQVYAATAACPEGPPA